MLDGSYSPTAKLPYTIYPAAFNLTRPITDMSLRGGQGITHLHYTGTPLWKFGYGESYTTFALSVEPPPLVADGVHVNAYLAAEEQAYTVRVENTGSVAGGTRVLGFVTCDDPAVGFPRQRLFGFAGVESLAPGEAATVALKLPTPKQLSVADADGKQWLHPAAFSLHVGGPPGEAAAVVQALELRGGAGPVRV